jgi:hypothetical protein
MRIWTIPLLGALALSLAVADPATARPRLGGALLGVFGGLLGARHAHRHYRHGARARAYARASAQAARRAAMGRDIGKPVAWAGAVFWPHAADDLFGYAFFPDSAGARFWAYGDILSDVFVDSGPPPTARGRASRIKRIRSASATNERATEPPLDACGSASGSNAADGVIDRIAQVVTPNDAQRALLAPLRTALVAAGERIAAVCPTDAAVNPLQRLDAMQDRIGALRDAALTIHVPLENFYSALSEAQKARLAGRNGEAGARQSAGQRASANCGQRPATGDGGAIERLINPTPDQRASLQALQMQFAGFGQLVLSACPGETPASPVERLDAAGKRLTTMLFAVMSTGPALQAFYGSLSDEQKANISNAMRRRAGERA